MTIVPGPPRLLEGGIVLIDADTGSVQRVIAPRYAATADTGHMANLDP